MTVSKLFYSREDRINEVGDDIRRFQNDDKTADADRLDMAIDQVVDTVYDLERIADEYAGIMTYSDNSTEEVIHARAKFVEAWAIAQVALSSLAWVARLDGNAAFDRIVEYGKTGNTYNMADL